LKARKSSAVKRYLALKAIKRANRKRLSSNNKLHDYVFDKLVYTKLREALGGRLRLVISGGARLSGSLSRFFTNIGVNIYQGYGLTESSPVLSTNYPGNNKNGTVGKVIPGVKVVISNEGEILASGDNIMLGYHNRPGETARVLDENGMLHTGDLGHFDEDGYLSITGRKKELFKTSTGEYVSPAPIEQKLRSHELIGNALVIAEGRKYVSSIIFPAYEELSDLKMKWEMGNATDEEFYHSELVQDSIKAYIDCINGTLNPWEQIRKFKIVFSELSIDKNELTPKLNIRRNQVYQSYQHEIENMYMQEITV
ncbi:MAG: AMP-binding protein, partial [Bacteroidales bacterium]|nr:AMP-binding protein [Bacteroidales bacterium]